uniref:Heterogeneous nuclear ribonucleoprotein A1 n=1 Tax=Heterorhabditis bacteriophora TaxID=37862 RepID=A0A1I7WN80_HETBA
MADEGHFQNGNAAGDTEPENFRKIFVGGLTGNTTDDVMREFYGQFGELTDIIVMRDPNTKRSRGFGFVTFGAKSMVDAAMAARPHVIDGKTVDPKRAVPRDDKNRNESNVSTKRLYVSGVREDHTEDMFTEYFSKFGTVVKAEIILDKVTNKPRGFGFVTFDDYDPVDQCVLLRSHMINGFRCDVKKGLSKDEMNKAQTQRDRTDRMGRSRGDQRGGYSGPGGGWGQQGGGQYGGPGGQRGGWGQQGYGQQGGYGGGQQGGGYGQQGGYGGYGQQQQGWGDQSGWGQQSGGGGGWGGQGAQQGWGQQSGGGGWGGQSGAQQWANAQGGGRY